MGYVGTVVLLGLTRTAHRILVGKFFLCGQMKVTVHGKITLSYTFDIIFEGGRWMELAGFILVVLYLPFLLPCYLPHIVEVGLNLKTTGGEVEHHFVQGEKKRKTLLESRC